MAYATCVGARPEEASSTLSVKLVAYTSRAPAIALPWSLLICYILYFLCLPDRRTEEKQSPRASTLVSESKQTDRPHAQSRTPWHLPRGTPTWGKSLSILEVRRFTLSMRSCCYRSLSAIVVLYQVVVAQTGARGIGNHGTLDGSLADIYLRPTLSRILRQSPDGRDVVPIF